MSRTAGGAARSERARWPWLAIAAAMLAALAIVLPARAGRAPVVLLGDSLAAGLAPPLCRLARADGVPCVAAARVGITTREARAAALGYGRVLPGALVLVSLGANDAATTRPTAELAADMGALVADVRARGGRPVWLAPPALPARLRDREVRAAIAASGAPVVEGGEVERAADGLHPTRAGYAAWAADVWRVVR